MSEGALVDVSTRACSKCGLVLPETLEFFRRRGTTDRGGLRPDCRACSAERDRRYNERTKDKRRAYNEANVEQSRRYLADYLPRYYRTDRGRANVAAKNARWARSDRGRERLRLAAQRRRHVKAGLPATLTDGEWLAAVETFDGRCAYCRAERPLTQEHVVPLARGGGLVAANIVPACGSCNSSKFDRPMCEWFMAQPFFDEAQLGLIQAWLFLCRQAEEVARG